MHHSGHLHLTQDKDGLTILNAEDFYAVLVLASKRYFDRRLVVFFASVSRVVDHCINRRLSERTKSLLTVFAKGVDLTSVPFDIFLVQRVHSRPARPNKKTSSMALSRIVRNPSSLRMPATTLKRRIAARFCRSRDRKSATFVQSTRKRKAPDESRA